MSKETYGREAEISRMELEIQQMELKRSVMSNNVKKLKHV